MDKLAKLNIAYIRPSIFVVFLFKMILILGPCSNVINIIKGFKVSVFILSRLFFVCFSDYSNLYLISAIYIQIITDKMNTYRN